MTTTRPYCHAERLKSQRHLTGRCALCLLTQRIYQQKRWQDRVLAGVCVDCKHKSLPPRIRCVCCLIRRRLEQRAQRARRADDWCALVEEIHESI